MLSPPPPHRLCVYEYETPAMNIDGDFNLTPKSRIYLPLENVHDELVVPSIRLISHSKRSVNNTCMFLPIQDQTLQSVFECCSTEKADAYGAIKFRYNNGSSFQNSTKDILISDCLQIVTAFLSFQLES